ncbi:protein YciI [Roseibium sp. TrichSKD4]|uniref:YciI-like protein n=1 Tax=Roseibium sp. TrichSKD4 TaxID=744980 RepID=UPI0001E56518|nr:YciI-like protein [Roseibium sp. TrichSKD4]EFO33450.1 protein YciI [Roseibium sp. TrichSKD4]
MLYALICTDKADALQIRMDNRPAHLEYLESLGDKLKGAGPFLGEDEKPSGSLVIVEAASRDEAAVIAENDPYAKAGLFENVDIRPWKWLIKNPEAN